MLQFRFVLTLVTLFVGWNFIGWDFIAADDFFVDKVAPLLQRRCLDCHNDGLSKGDFSLSNALHLEDSGFVDPGNPQDSYLIELVTPVDGKAEMPQDAAPLNDDEIAILREWISQGATWTPSITLQPFEVTDRDWWSLKPIQNTDAPDGNGDFDHASVNPVDAFIDRALRIKGLQPVERASPAVLIRRLTYDLTGLAPTPDEVESFIQDWSVSSRSAWETLVDRLLSSERFGEKFAQHWLDVARYAETHGFDKDKPRQNAWPYRDYVIRAFNNDKPYDRFVQEQVAGDVLFKNDPEGVLGLGFLAAGPWDFISHWEVGESKLDGRIAKHLDRDEMIAAVFNVFQSTTVQCAQCHHHKFDPIRMEDYYRLHAVFAAVDRADRVYAGLSNEQQQQKDRLIAQIDELEHERDSLRREQNEAIARQTQSIDEQISELKLRFGSSEPQHPHFGYHSQIESESEVEKWVQIDFDKPFAIDEIQIFPAFDQYADIGAGFGFPVRYRVEASVDGSFDNRPALLLDASDRDQDNPGCTTLSIEADLKAIRSIRITATKLRERRDDFIFALAEIKVLAGGNNVAKGAQVTAKDSIEAPVRWSKSNLVDGIYYKELTDESAEAQLQQLRIKREQLVRKFRSKESLETIAGLNQSIEKRKVQLNHIPEGQFVYAASTVFPGGGQFKATNGKPRPIHLLRRGDLKSPAEAMTPGVPSMWGGERLPFFENGAWDEGEARLRLARYLTQDDNPLVWRSIVNRIWGWTFGAPIVGTSNDFGRSGQQPTHPELLDYLAAKMRDDPNHSIKSIVRLLVSSDAYQRSSRIDPAMQGIDAENAYYWRFNRRRLTAEEFRDSLYQIAGILDLKMGGPSFRDFVVEKPEHSPHYEYELHDLDDPTSHRRSVYRFIVRSQPQPMLTTLDCADPSISIPRRDESTTALQALTYWNDRLVEFIAEQFGEQLRKRSPTNEQRVRDACRCALGREPSDFELTELQSHLRRHGEASLARVIFNLNAFLYLD
ncbi:PSD1 and planctomycete cytochrome C domain-containing protein [Stieleria sp. JC731]|uniref:PSD1 and planctomycete cytochrome C domain-containing protein n=1 Tax=Pirellulaceae TaxID=2691357 RepID=UPI001E2F103A|nr:PSD1 and planctomycete cytochrome C domain-containing protein [Stieleria sp. JC731]MCC9599164.1 PSD1 and planctomycete cytochrome C domain-containing protein [Stieleria sp. JC731]